MVIGGAGQGKLAWALAMTGPGDTDETLGALARALRAID